MTWITAQFAGRRRERQVQQQEGACTVGEAGEGESEVASTEAAGMQVQHQPNKIQTISPPPGRHVHSRGEWV